ncbi:aminotransferase class IV [Bacteroidota bacterium]
MCLLLETIRVKDGSFCHCGYHQKRMDHTRETLFPGAEKLLISDIEIPETFQSGIYKCRIVYDQELKRIQFSPYTPRQIRKLKLVDAGSLEYPFKYLNRSGIEQLQKGHADFNEIILVKNGYITDTSFSNLAFLSDNKWFTPDNPLLNGTCRQRLIDKGIIRPIPITPDNLCSFKFVSLINAMLDLNDTVLPIEAIEL